jgi:hypothetical protein
MMSGIVAGAIVLAALTLVFVAWMLAVARLDRRRERRERSSARSYHRGLP